MNAEEFSRNEDNRAGLARVLADPYFTAAMAILADEISPSVESPAKANPVLAASLYHQAAGVNFVRNGLVRLTKLPVERKVPQVKHLKPTPRDSEESIY